MLFRDARECEARATRLGIRLLVTDRSDPERNEAPFVRFSIEQTEYVAIAIARRIVSWLGEFTECEFWISEFGIWPAREDFNLYCRLRSTYADTRELHEAPAHLFFDKEQQDLATFLGIAIQFGWGGHLIPNPTAAYVFLSHDGWIHVESSVSMSRTIGDLQELEIQFDSSSDE